jgi:hypothetical protein
MENILKRCRNADGLSYNYLCMGDVTRAKPPFLFFGVVAVMFYPLNGLTINSFITHTGKKRMFCCSKVQQT